MRRYTSVLLGIMILMTGTQALFAKDAAVPEGGTVLGTLKVNGCSRAWLAQVLADSGLTMASARKIKPQTIIALPERCDQEAPASVKAATRTLIADERANPDSDPAALIKANEQPGGDTATAAQLLAEQSARQKAEGERDAAQQRAKELEEQLAAARSPLLTFFIILFVGLTAGFLGSQAFQYRARKKAAVVPHAIVCIDPEDKPQEFPVSHWDAEGDTITVTCLLCRKSYDFPLARAKEGCRAHLWGPDHAELRNEVIASS